MKSLLYSLPFLFAACSTPTVDTSKPENIPDWVRWGTYEHYAYLDNRIHFNADSTIMLTLSDRKPNPNYEIDTSRCLVLHLKP